jgi:SP family myo-inositol transporter-like MFS transporter 13
MSESCIAAAVTTRTAYNRFLLLVAGLGGLLYGVDVGIIAGALPYLEATSGLNAGQLSFIVAAVLLGSVISTLFAGMLADWMGRKKLMVVQRNVVCHQHSDDCSGARLWAAGLRPACCKGSAPV